MQIQQTNNQPNFGIRIKNPTKFSNELLRAVIYSPMTKAIDERFPKASLEYRETHFTRPGSSMRDMSKPTHSLVLKLNSKVKGYTDAKYNEAIFCAYEYRNFIEGLKQVPKEVSELLENRNEIERNTGITYVKSLSNCGYSKKISKKVDDSQQKQGNGKTKQAKQTGREYLLGQVELSPYNRLISKIFGLDFNRKSIAADNRQYPPPIW